MNREVLPTCPYFWDLLSTLRFSAFAAWAPEAAEATALALRLWVGLLKVAEWATIWPCATVLFSSVKHSVLRYSCDFSDPVTLLEAADRMGLEGVVCKRVDQRYVSGNNPGWVKVKTDAWRAANRDRGKLFEK